MNKMYCINCGAPLNGRSKCEYCGTEYGISANINEGIGILHFNGEDIRVYLECVNTDMFTTGAGRNIDGRMQKVNVKMQRTFTLREF
jgi:hypothetical protein